MKDYTKWEAHWRGTSHWRLSAVRTNGLRRVVFDGVEAERQAVAELVDTLNGRPHWPHDATDRVHEQQAKLGEKALALSRAEELLRQALAALEYHREQTRPIERTTVAIAALREHLEPKAGAKADPPPAQAVALYTQDELDAAVEQEEKRIQAALCPGWRFKRGDNNCIVVTMPDGGGCVVAEVAPVPRQIPEEVLFALCKAMGVRTTEKDRAC